MTSMSRKALGKGLSALLRDREGTTESELCELDIDLLEPNRFQPRQTFSVEELAQSIKTHGLVQPIIARQNGDRYQIIAGERRWRAAQRLGLLKVPVMVKQVADEELLETSLIENIQRENLNPIEEAKAYQRLGHEFSLTQDQVAQRTSKERSTITNFIRLLKLPKEIQQLVLDDQLSMGHARALLSLENAAEQRVLAERAVQDGWSVRQVERTIALQKNGTPKKEAQRRVDPNVKAAIEKLERALGTRVRIIAKGKSGRIEIDYYSSEELQRLYEYLTQEPQPT
ncbi:MAG: chromosome partitioning protein ParB [Acidobacteria bacterium]|nr:MAG: chromosome partitioning protein ParB [Acidobacteriota bacterium]